MILSDGGSLFLCSSEFIWLTSDLLGKENNLHNKSSTYFLAPSSPLILPTMLSTKASKLLFTFDSTTPLLQFTIILLSFLLVQISTGGLFPTGLEVTVGWD